MEAYFAFLVELRDSGKTNMFGARPYLIKKFPELDQKTADHVLMTWFRSLQEKNNGRV